MFINIHTHKLVHEERGLSIFSSGDILSDCYCSIGLHPWYISPKNYIEKLKKIESNALNPNVLAIGEIGLDKLCKVDLELQKHVFVKQLEVAERLAKPVIIHCVKAFDEILFLTKRFKCALIIHGFSKGDKLAEEFTSKGFYLSFGKSLLDENSRAKEAFKNSPPDKLFLETDESELSIAEIYNTAAGIKNMEIGILELQLEQNFRKVFNRCIANQ